VHNRDGLHEMPEADDSSLDKRQKYGLSPPYRSARALLVDSRRLAFHVECVSWAQSFIHATIPHIWATPRPKLSPKPSRQTGADGSSHRDHALCDPASGR